MKQLIIKVASNAQTKIPTMINVVGGEIVFLSYIKMLAGITLFQEKGLVYAITFRLRTPHKMK